MSSDRHRSHGADHWEEEFKLGRGQDKLFGLALLSRYPILAKSAIRFDNDKNNSGMYVDLLVGSDTVRVYNMHLSSIGFEKEDYEDARNVQDEAARLQLYNRLAAAWQNRTDQAEQVAASVAEARIVIGRGLQRHASVLRGAAIQYLPARCLPFSGSIQALAGRVVHRGFAVFAHRSGVGSRGWTWWTTKRVASNYPTTARSAWHQWEVIKRGAPCRRRVSAGLQCLQCA